MQFTKASSTPLAGWRFRLKKVVSWLLLAVLLCAPLGGQAKAKKPSYAQQVLALVNAERARNGLPALAECPLLQPVATLRAREAAASFSHTRPNGTSWRTAFNEYHIVSVCRGENLAYGVQTPEEVVAAWMGSKRHRENILNSKYAQIAIGYEVVGGVPYWSQVFAGEDMRQEPLALSPPRDAVVSALVAGGVGV